MSIKVTRAAKNALQTGIAATIIRRSSGGQICQHGYILCGDGRVLRAYWDRSEPSDSCLQDAAILRQTWASALLDACNS
jgi:hypothetical protein